MQIISAMSIAANIVIASPLQSASSFIDAIRGRRIHVVTARCYRQWGSIRRFIRCCIITADIGIFPRRCEYSLHMTAAYWRKRRWPAVIYALMPTIFMNDCSAEMPMPRGSERDTAVILIVEPHRQCCEVCIVLERHLRLAYSYFSAAFNKKWH